MRGGRVEVGGHTLADAPDMGEGAAVHLVVRAYELKFWGDDAGFATVRRVTTLGDRVRVEAWIDGAGVPIFAQFPRRSSLLTGVEAGQRIAVEITQSRAFAATDGAS